MENVLIMYEAELRRKKQLTQTIEYHDLEQLKNILQQWQALGPFGQVNKSYGEYSNF
jgi:hypothetical protein